MVDLDLDLDLDLVWRKEGRQGGDGDMWVIDEDLRGF